MLGGGKWTKQDKKLPGVYINVISKVIGHKKSNTPVVESENTLLVDCKGVPLKTSDGKYLAVKT